jgi:3-dehydroshikimate dehydratase
LENIMITVSFCSLAYRTEPIEDLIPKIAKCGYDAVEIFGGQIEGKTDEQLKSIRRTAEQNNLKIVAISPYLSLTKTKERYDESIARVRDYLHYGEVLGCKRIRTFTDVGREGTGSADATPEIWAQGIRGLKEITGIGKGYEFLLETHPWTLADTLEATQRVIRETAAPNLKVLYQPSTEDFVNKGIIECWRILKPDVAHMHLQNVGSEHGYLDTGKLDLANYLRTVKSDGYDGSMSVEYHWKDTPWERVKDACDFVAQALGRTK